MSFSPEWFFIFFPIIIIIIPVILIFIIWPWASAK